MSALVSGRLFSFSVLLLWVCFGKPEYSFCFLELLYSCSVLFFGPLFSGIFYVSLWPFFFLFLANIVRVFFRHPVRVNLCIFLFTLVGRLDTLGLIVT